MHTVLNGLDDEVGEVWEERATATAAQVTGISAKGNVNVGGNIQNYVTQVSRRFGSMREPVKDFWTVSLPTRDFQGRHQFLQSIDVKLQGCRNSVHWQNRTVTLVGYGGMGKSELARTFATNYRGIYSSAAWIQAQTEESMRKSFLELAKLLCLRIGLSDDAKGIAKKVFRHVGKHIPSALFIYDNAEKLKSTDAAFGILDYLPQEIHNNPPLILVTSQTATEWRRERIEIVRVTELTESESIEFLRLRLGLSTEELRRKRVLKAQVQELSECLQGYPLGLQLAAGSIMQMSQDEPRSVLQTNLENWISIFKGETYMELMEQPPLETVNGYPRSFGTVWKTTMRRLEDERYATEALRIVRILAYCNPDKTKIHSLLQIYSAAVPEEVRTVTLPMTDDTFDLALAKLQQLSLISKYDNGWGLRWESCVRMHRIVQKLIRRDDVEKVGLQIILLSDKHFFLLNYMTCKPILTMYPSILRNDQLIDRWLLCFGWALRLGRHFPFHATVRLEFNSEHEQELRSRASVKTEGTLRAVEFIRKMESEKDVGALYLSAVEYANANCDSDLHHVAEYCAFKCLTSRPFSCNPFIYWMFALMVCVDGALVLAHCIVVCLQFVIFFFIFDPERRTKENSVFFIGLPIVQTVIVIWVLRSPKSYFWLKMVLSMKKRQAHMIRLLYATIRLVVYILDVLFSVCWSGYLTFLVLSNMKWAENSTTD